MSLTRLALFTLVSLITIGLTSAVDIYDCQILDVEGETYILQNDIITENSVCFDIISNNITLDLNGFEVASTSNGEIGVLLVSVKSVSIKKGAIDNFEDGILILGGMNHFITNVTLINAQRGIYFASTSYNKINDVSISNSSEYDFYIYVREDSHCDHVLINIKGADNKPVVFHNSAVNVSGLNPSELILCNADASLIKETTIANKNKVNGLLMLRTNDAVLLDMHINNSHRGAWIINGDNNVITNSSFMNSEKQGLLMWAGSDNEISNSIIRDNRLFGLELASANHNEISGNKVENNGAGIVMQLSGEFGGNLIYNNFFNNTNNVASVDGANGNSWNVTRLPGPNIVGGPFIGGNYWANPESNGYSQTCRDSNRDGFCDLPYILNKNNVDYLPLSNLFLKTRDVIEVP